MYTNTVKDNQRNYTIITMSEKMYTNIVKDSLKTNVGVTVSHPETNTKIVNVHLHNYVIVNTKGTYIIYQGV